MFHLDTYAANVSIMGPGTKLAETLAELERKDGNE